MSHPFKPHYPPKPHPLITPPPPNNNQVAIRTTLSVPEEVFFTCKSCFRLFRSYDIAIKHFRTSATHANELHLAIQNRDDDDDESIDNAAATLITEMIVLQELLPEPYSSRLKRKAVSAVVAAPVKKTRLDIDYEDNRSIQNVITGYTGTELTEACKVINKAPVATLDGSNLDKAAVTGLHYTDNRTIQNVFTR